MRNIEDQIIAYLDGTLDEHSRSELLHTLSTSPEKRRLLEEHIKLREMISLGHKPHNVPLHLEERLAARIPVLMQELPYLAERGARVAAPLATASIWSASVNALRTAFSTRLIPAVSLGTIAAIGITWFALTRDGAQQASTTSKNTAIDSHGSTQTDPAKPSNAANMQSTSNDAATEERLAVKSFGVEGRSYRLRESASNQKSVSLGDGSSDSYQVRQDIVDNATQKENATPTEEGEAEEVSPPVKRQTEELLPASPSAINPYDADALPLPSSNSVTGRFSVQTEYSTGVNFRPNQQSQEYQRSDTRSFPILGIGYQLSPYINIGIEGGSAVLSQQSVTAKAPTPQMVTMKERSSLDRRIEYTREIVDIDAYWAQATFRYTLNPDDRVRFEALAGAGAALINGASPMLALGLASSIEITKHIALTAGITARGAWLDAASEPLPEESTLASNEAIGYVRQESQAANVFSPSLGGRAGIRFSF